MRSFTRGFLMWGALALPGMAAFVPPAEGPVPFRRDRLPVDVDTMTALSRELTVLARTAADFPKPGRTVAQMAALALALDPSNREARDLLQSMKLETAPEAAGVEEVEKAKNRAWQALAWLEMPEAGADGQALAACLADVLAVADPEHPKAKAHASEKGAWKDWVAEPAAFESDEKATEPEEPEKSDDPVPTTPGKGSAALALNQLELTMPLWHSDPETREVSISPVPVEVQASVSEEGGVVFQVAGEELADRFSRAFRHIESALKQRHGSLPNGLRVNVKTGKISYSFSRNGLALTGTTALLVDGALSGKMPTATALAVVGEGGKLELPPGFWKTLRAMAAAPGDGGRIILPAAAADYLTGLVVMDDAAFFMKYEVLLASTVGEMCDLAAATPKPEVADGLKRFAEIRKVGEGKPLGTFVAHPATQQRLRDLTGAMPEHASARLLGLQGSGNRPRFLQRSILAREIRGAVEPVAYLVTDKPDELEPKKLEGAHESSRAALDKLTGYIDIRDRDLHKAAVDVADSLRTLARLLEKRDSEKPQAMMEKQSAAWREARDGYQKLMRDLGTAAGDADEFAPPKPRPDK